MHSTLISGEVEEPSVGVRSGNILVAEYDVKDELNMIITPNLKDEFGVDFNGRSLENTFIEEGLLIDRDIPLFSGLFLTDGTSEDLHINIQLLNKNKQYRWYKLSSLKIRDERNKIEKLFIVLADIDEEVKYKNELEYVSCYDRLTGALNKQGFYQKANEYIKKNSGKRFKLIRIDIQRFSMVNTILGIDVGDEIIKFIADELIKKTKNCSVMGRIAGDVFAIITDNDDLIDKLDLIHVGRVSAPGICYDLDLATGIYEIEDENMPIEVMCDMANMAVRTAKVDFYKKVAYYEAGLREKFMEEQKIIQEMESALEEGQFHVYLQPQYDLNSKKMIAAEALVRWIHPVEGILSPDKFIPLFEKNGFITRLDEYVLEQVCKLIRRWGKERKSLIPISVNISRVDLFKNEFGDRIQTIVKEYGVDPKYIELELTESAYVDSPEMLIEKVEILQKSGFKVLMDDFGSGYSSLNMLKDVPVDKLKIDLKFLEGITESERGGDILKTMMHLASVLNIPTIAEGVESDAQADILIDMGCDYVQGYLFNRPMPIEDFEHNCLALH